MVAAPTALARAGGWLFSRRSWLPIPLVALLLSLPPQPGPFWVPLAGSILVASGELLRLWGVRHIGVISRTRSDRLGPLVETGPFAHVRNPLYLGNIAIWVGFCLCARVTWLAPVALVVFAAEYHAIVCWEESLLQAHWGAPYAQYIERVPRWLPLARPGTPAGSRPPMQAYSWADTLYSERGTLIAIALGYALLAAKRALSGA